MATDQAAEDDVQLQTDNSARVGSSRKNRLPEYTSVVRTGNTAAMIG